MENISLVQIIIKRHDKAKFSVCQNRKQGKNMFFLVLTIFQFCGASFAQELQCSVPGECTGSNHIESKKASDEVKSRS